MDIVAEVITIRRKYRLKTPDAIIAASAVKINVPLVSADKEFRRVHGLVVISDII
jgi:predicted nucleic acid-binding protein